MSIDELNRIRSALAFECTTATDGNYREKMVLVRASDINRITDAIHDLDDLIAALPKREISNPDIYATAQAIIESIWDVWYGKKRGDMNAEDFSALLGEAKTRIVRAVHNEYEKQGTAFASIAVNLRRCLPHPEQHAALIAFVDHVAAGDTVVEAHSKAEKLLPKGDVIEGGKS